MMKIESNNWKQIDINSVDEAFSILDELAGKRWMTRGQSRFYEPYLIPPIDRYGWDRKKIIHFERQSMILFRSSIKYFSEGEKDIFKSDILALALMQHHLVPTRLLDWSLSPVISMYFAVRDYCEDDSPADGEIWAFDYAQYMIKGPVQWVRFPEATTDGVHFDNEMPTIFAVEEPKNQWFVLQFFPPEFSRINAQQGFFSVTSKFGTDHAKAIQDLLENESSQCKYVINKKIKKDIKKKLKDDYEIWEGSLFPDSDGVSDAIREAVFSLPR